ncbi:GNAT family N-acetyltransferase [Polaromonas eurypsychrophila]|uniref:Acetyltransferase n=1 Tax=Polaromonas eurypsychrophila TaxID=1614635 RepID=A0A916SU58_9BURK|nr:GNAT family N-acetyltransferase [Polaromonas eurypsychrophila]GGB13499.1 acetyltransferase [Polaromonas eurypsychrophila]
MNTSGSPLAAPAHDVEGIERATASAVSPESVEELDGWLLAFDRGSVNRAKSAVPLQHAACDEAVVGKIEARYAAHGLAPLFRLPTLVCFEGMRRELRLRSYSAQSPTRVQLGGVSAMRALCIAPPADIAGTPDAAWVALFLGEGVDPVDGASRVAGLSRAPGSLYASVREGGHTVAAGAAAFSHGWVSVHGMRTAPAWRGRGMAGRILAALADAATTRGLERCFLQVEAGNTAAQSLYRRAGFASAWTYEYWRRD